MKQAWVCGLLSWLAAGADYSAVKDVVDGIEVVRLRDGLRRTEVTIVPSIGNTVIAMNVNGKNILWFPEMSLAEWKKAQITCGIPLLSPWANRLDGNAFWANNKRFLLNPDLGNLRRDQAGLPIHGVLYFSDAWRTISVNADSRSAQAVSQLEFWRWPEMMAQFPFAHTLTMTHRLVEGVLEVELRIVNHSTTRMPLAVGFHPFFRLHDSPRSEWRIHIPAQKRYVLDKRMIPTGETEPAPYADPQTIGTLMLDDELTDLVRGSGRRVTFWLQGKRERITVEFGPNYPVATVFTPAEKQAVCIEPMTAITNAFNLAHNRSYRDLQSIPPNGVWKESFWIRVEGSAPDPNDAARFKVGAVSERSSAH